MKNFFSKLGNILEENTESQEKLGLPEPARSLWLKTHALIEETFRRTGQCRLGGGTLLSARWKHRLSLDIDLTIEPAGRNPQTIEHLLDEQSPFRRAIAGLGAGKPTTKSPYHIRVPFGESVLDIAILDAQPNLGERRATVDGKPAVVLSTTQILAGKLTRSGDLLHRDAFDIRHASRVDKQSLAEAVNRIHPRDMRNIISLWNRVEQRWAAWAPSQLRNLTPKHAYDAATLATETASALRNALYRHVRITTHGREGNFHAKTADDTSVDIRFTRRTLARDFSEHGINEYLAHQNPGFGEEDIFNDIKKACRLGTKPQTIYETNHNIPPVEPRRTPRILASGKTPNPPSAPTSARAYRESLERKQRKRNGPSHTH